MAKTYIFLQQVPGCRLEVEAPPDEMIKYCALMLFDPLIIMFYLNISEEVALDRSAWRLAINVPEP